MTDPLHQYKLIVLFMLHQVRFPLTRVQLFDFILQREYTNYFTLQQAIAELIDAALISSKSNYNSTLLSLTDEGKTTLSYFENRIPDVIKEEIREYFQENLLTIRNDVSLQTDYYKSTNGEYTVKLAIKGEKDTPIELTLSAPNQETAAAICKSWIHKNQEIYAHIMKELL